ncbi:MAG: VWFA-related Acidobacterial domain protein [Candidatus Aminicenantes bacterium]|nr:VWFA-related Acidobacterial domain protein [Candidatus Aminicenantes bacterium]
MTPSGRPQEKKQGLEYQVSVSAISIAVVVQGKDGRYINDLTQDDFTVYENEVKQTVSYFQHDFEAPVSLAILLDVSGSMGLQDKLKESREALRDFVDGLLRPQDEVSLLVFADGEVEVAAPFSTDKSGCLAELAKAEAYGQTALYDAVAVSPEFANRGKHEKRAILLITDGIENDSQASVDQAVEIARRVDVPIFTIGYKIPLSEEFLRKYKKTSALTSAGIVSALERFSQATGGRLQVATDPRELAAAFREIKRELGHQYIIGYTSYKSPKNEYRKIRVVTSNKKYKVRTREGY